MYLVAAREAGSPVSLPQAALRDSARNDRDVVVTQRADWLARTSGRRALPWRIVMIADEDRAAAAESDGLPLAAPSRLADVSWIRPGKVSWDWWNNLNLRGVSFHAGVNNETYKYFIDFASKNGHPVHHPRRGLVQAGRSADAGRRTSTCRRSCGTARRRTSASSSGRRGARWTPRCSRRWTSSQKWGVKGIKVDFMQRDDQPVVNYYFRVAREAAATRICSWTSTARTSRRG